MQNSNDEYAGEAVDRVVGGGSPYQLNETRHTKDRAEGALQNIPEY